MGSCFAPNLALRQGFANEAQEVACLFIDVQNYSLHDEGGCMKGAEGEGVCTFVRVEREKCIPKWRKLQAACREANVEVMYCVIQSLTKDGRDRSLDYKITGFHVPPGSWDAQVLDCIRPGEDEIVLAKTSCSVFQSTNLDYLLRAMEKKYLLVCGTRTDQCVSHAVRDGCDLGYRITLLTDACVAESREAQDRGIASMAGFSRFRTVDEVTAELQELQSS